MSTQKPHGVVGNPPSASEIERLVREVLARMESSSPALKQSTTSETKSNVAKVLEVADAVVSLRSLEGRLAGIVNVLAPAKSVLTPAARDLLRQHKIGFQRQIKETAPRNSRQLTVGVAIKSFEIAGLIASLRTRGEKIQQIASTGLVTTTADLCDAVAGGGDLGLLVTDQTVAAVALANRRSGIRSAAAADMNGLRTANEQLGVNLLAIDPRGMAIFAVTKLIEAFVKEARLCPAELRTALA